MSQLEPKGRPKGTKRSQRDPNGAKWETNGSQKSSQNGASRHLAGHLVKREQKGIKTGSRNGAIFHQKVDQKIGAEIDAGKVIILKKIRRRNCVRI